MASGQREVTFCLTSDFCALWARAWTSGGQCLTRCECVGRGSVEGMVVDLSQYIASR